MGTALATQTQTRVNSCDAMRNTTSCVSASQDVRQAPAEPPQPTKAAKKRAKKVNKDALAKVTEGLKDMQAVSLSGDALAEAKEVDQATARREVIKSVNADAAAVAEKWVKYGELCEAEDEAKQKRIVFRENFEGDAALRKRWQNVRDFFVTKKTHEFVTGKDGTHYFTLPQWCKGECGVTYEYCRRLDPRYAKLKNQIEAPPQPQSGDGTSLKLPRVSSAAADQLPDDNGDELEVNSVSPQQEEANHAASVDEKVRFVLAYAGRFASMMSVDEKEDFYQQLVEKFQTEVEFPIDVTVSTQDSVTA